jgi:hypothetical protein
MKKMFGFTHVVVMLSIVFVFRIIVIAGHLPLDPHLIALDDQRGQKLLFESKYNHQFWKLIPYYAAQERMTTCGLASMVMVLNTLGFEASNANQEYGDKYHIFTENNLALEIAKVIDIPAVYRNGMGLGELPKALSCFTVDIQIVYAHDVSYENFIKALENSMSDPEKFIILDYLRTSVWQVGGGHFSPIGAYNKNEQKVLILDVARHKYPPVWVPLEDLYKGCLVIDSDTHKSRGFIIISRKK